MTSKNSSHNAFSFTFKRMFKQSLPLALAPVGVVFIISMINMIQNLISFGSISTPSIPDKDYFGFNSLLLSNELFYGILILVSCLFGLIAFRFLTNKKECNVYLSLGISKNKMFWSRYLGAAVALVILIVGVCFFDYINACEFSFSRTNKYEFILFLCSLLYLIGSAMCAYSVTVLSFVNAGNIVEGTVFTFFFGIFPTIFTMLSESAYGNLTYGSAYGTEAYSSSSKFYNKNWFLDIFASLSEREIQQQFSQSGLIKNFKMPNLTGMFVCFAAFILIAVLASLMFKKRTSENSGTVFKSYNLYRILFVLAGILTFALMTSLDIANRYLKADIAILAGVIVCIVGTLIFTRKIPTKTAVSLAASLGVFCLICFIGYGASVPEIADIKTVDVMVNPELAPYSGATDSYSLFDGTAVSSHTPSYDYYATLKSDNDIKWITDIHKDLVDYGYHTKCDDNSANATVIIKYNLKNGKSIAKRYNFETAETYKKILGFMKTDKGSEYFEKLFSYKKIGEGNSSDNDEVDYYYYGSTTKGKMFDLLLNSYDMTDADGYAVKAAVLDKNNTVYVGFNDKNNLYLDCKKVELMENEGFRDALYKDLKNQTVEQRYFHSSSDEIGMLVVTQNEGAIANAYVATEHYKKADTSKDEYIGETWTNILDEDLYGSLHYYDDETEQDDVTFIAPIDTELYRKNKDKAMKLYFANGFCNNNDIESAENVFKTVVTKDMTNTVKWLNDNGLYKENASNGAKVVSARGFKANVKTYSTSPFQTTFISALRNGFGKDTETAIEYGNHVYFGGSGTVKDQKTIEALLSNSRLSAAKLQDNYIVEFTFDDGSQVTKFVSSQNVPSEAANVFGVRTLDELPAYSDKYYPVTNRYVTTMPAPSAGATGVTDVTATASYD